VISCIKMTRFVYLFYTHILYLQAGTHGWIKEYSLYLKCICDILKLLTLKHHFRQYIANMKLKSNKRLILFSKRVSLYFVILLILAAILPYIAGLNGDFVFDDQKLIVEDPFYQAESNPLHCMNRSFWKSSISQGLYRPVTVFSYWLDARIFAKFANSDNGLWSPGFRAVNLLLHILITLLIFKLALRLRFGRATAFIASAIFALHPIHVEAVTPAFGRGELLCTFFLLAGLVMHTYRKRSPWYVVFSALSFMLAFMSKENGIIFLPAILIIDFFSRSFSSESANLAENDIPKWRKFTPYIIYLLPVLAVFLMRHHFLGTWLPAKQNFDPFIDNPLALSDFPHRFVGAVRVHGIALYKFFVPAVLSCDYSYARILPVKALLDGYAIFTFALFIAIPAIFAKFFPHDRRKVLMLLLLYLISILPAGNFIIPAGTVFAERLQYTPSIWLSLFVAMVFMRISRFLRHPISLLLLLGIFSAMFARTVLRTSDWKNNETLWRSAVITTPQSLKVLNNYAVSVCGKNGDYRTAIAACSAAIDIHPRYANGYANRGLYLAKLGMQREAEKDFRKAISIFPNNETANFNLGILLANQGKIKEARILWLKLYKINPNNKRVNAVLKQSENDMK